MALTRYPQLQSGFLGMSETGLTKSVEPASTPEATLMHRFPGRTQEDYFYCPALEQLFNELIQDPIKIKEIAWQQNYLQVIGSLFDRHNFQAFIRLQEGAPNLSGLHIKFLDETVKLVNQAIPRRSVSIHTWASMLSCANGGSAKPFKAGDFLKANFSSYQNYTTLADFIVQWIRIAGWTDFVFGMQVLFGRRTLNAVLGAPN